jgi:hypothetical protein
MIDAPLNIDTATIYRFRVIGNYDDGVIGSAGTALDNEKTKFLICEDVAEADNADHPRNGYRYIVARPKYLWNATSPKFYSGATDSSGDYPIKPAYSENDEIQVMGLFAESINPADSLTYSASLKTYIQTFHSTDTPIANWNEINTDSIIKLYFIDLNQDARTREASGGEGSCTPVIVSSPNIFPPPGTKTAIIKNDFLDAYHSMYCIESSEVWFQDILQVKCGRTEQLDIPKEFLAICEPNSFVINSCTCDLPVNIGIFTKADKIYINNPSGCSLNLVITISGIRKGCLGGKYHSVSQKVFEHNNEFWNKWRTQQIDNS